jgi:hypothetical protein
MEGSVHQAVAAHVFAEAQDRLHTSDYVEARAILVPATEYLQRAVNAARNQSRLTGTLLSTVCSSEFVVLKIAD